MESPKETVEPLVAPDEYTVFHLPGYTLPLDFQPGEEKKSLKYNFDDLKSYWVYHKPDGSGKPLLPSVLIADDVSDGACSLPLLPLREITMLQIMNEITDKPDWCTKIFNEEIVHKWREEILRGGSDVTQSMMDWVVAELRYRAPTFEQSRMYTVYNGCVVKSDAAVSHTLKDALQKTIQSLESVSEPDWHPGSDGKVLDLVHPSLFPLVYGRSRILKNELVSLEDSIAKIGQGEVLPVPQLQSKPTRGQYYAPPTTNPYSTKFQWLPCEVKFSPDSGCKIVSYINNLHPQKYQDLYHIIEQVIDRAIPLWNVTLLEQDHRYRHKTDSYLRIQYDEAEYETVSEEQPEQLSDEDDDVYWDRRALWDEQHRVVIPPEPKEFSPPPQSLTMDLREDNKERGLQVIVKLANIHLTPEKPEYEGGSWHVEGKLNEHICATALYYYDSSNITESRLAFRQQVSHDATVDIGYEQDHHEWLEVVFGCHQDGPGVQVVGDVVCKEGRLLTFPNILQHRVSPFSLADPTKPGHRKILALFLVDPSIRVISTANIPPQQHDWWTGELTRLSALGKLPLELQYQVMKEADFPIQMEEAKNLRGELMEERKTFVQDQQATFEMNTFSLCEH